MGAFHDFEHQGWQTAAAHYAGSFGELTARAAEPLLDAARVGQGTRVLDVATGPGYVAAAAAQRGAVVDAIDFAPEMVALARKLHPAVAVREGDAEALAGAAGSRDAVVMSFGLLHLERPEAAIAEAHRVLAPGGRYAFTVWAPPAQARGFGMVLEAMAAHGRLDVGLPEGPPFFRFGDPDESRRALAQAGFRDIAVATLPLVWRLRSPDQLFEAALRGGVRTSAVMQAQTPEALASIRNAIALACATYADGDGFAIPMPVILASATK
jgi:ubiquinone/menaquinone biosynthesis C-methylase UbiE